MRFSSNLLKKYKSLLKTSFSFKNVLLPNYKAVLLKKAFCFTSAQRIALCVENSVSRHFVLETSFGQIIRISCSKMRFASNLLNKYNSLFKTSFCVTNFLLATYMAVLLKNVFCFTSAQRIARCVENSVSRHFVLETSFCQLIGISCSKIRFSSNLLKTYKSLLKTSFCV